MSELTKRILVAVVGIPIAFFLFYTGGVILMISIAIISTIALNEFYNMFEQTRNLPIKITGIILELIPLAVIITSILIAECDLFHEISYVCGEILKLLIIFAFVPVIMIFPALLGMLFSKKFTSAAIGLMLISYFYITIPLLSLIFIRNISFYTYEIGIIYDFGIWFTILMFSSIWICDSAAYFIGRKFGKHKLFPSVSPNKSIEGAVAGFVAAAVWFPTVSHLVIPQFDTYAIMIGIIIGICGQLGDLIESKFKRESGIKDSSHIIPGHGGILDRFDSIIFVSPIVLIILLVLIE